MSETTWLKFAITELISARQKFYAGIAKEVELSLDNLQHILTLAAIPGGLANHYLGVLGSFSDYLRGAMSAIVARVAFDLTVDRGLRQRVIPLDRVAREIGVDLVRDILSFGSANPPPKKPFGRFSDLRRALAGQIGPVVKETVTKAIVVRFAGLLNVLLTAGAILFAIVMAFELRDRTDKLIRAALPQKKPRSRYPAKPIPLRRRPV